MAHKLWSITCCCLTVLLWTVGPAAAGTQDTSGITVQTVIDRFRIVVTDADSKLLTDTQVLQWVEEACQLITEEARCLEVTETTTLAASVGDYTITTPHYDIESAYLYTGAVTGFQYKFLNKADPRDLRGKQYETGEPTLWFEWGGRINVWPIPSASEAGYSLTVLLAGQPTAITVLTQAIQTPYYLDPAYIDYLCYRYWMKAQDFDRSAAFFAKFQAALARYSATIRGAQETTKGASQ